MRGRRSQGNEFSHEHVYTGMIPLIRQLINDIRMESRHGLASIWNYVHPRVYSSSCMLLYCRHGGESPTVPCSICIVRARPSRIEQYRSLLAEVGAESDMRNAARGASAYLVIDAGKAVACGWRFRSSRLLRRLGYSDREACYYGGFVTHSDMRGKGYYPLLLSVMCADEPSNILVFAETSRGNRASQRGLVKAGFTLHGMVYRIILFGMMLRCKVTTQVPLYSGDRWTIERDESGGR